MPLGEGWEMSLPGKTRTGSASGVVTLMDLGGHQLQKGQA